MESRMTRVERSLEYLVCKVKKLSEMNGILEEKVRALDGVNKSKSKDLLSDSEKQAMTEHMGKFKPSNNQKRDNVIRKAKQFVSLHKGNGQRQVYLPYTSALIFYNIDFKIKKNKRTVTAYLIGEFTGHKHKKVTIQCHPNDVFNEDLGKAIAIGKLLKLDVSEFEDAPQPDAPVVGHVITRINSLGNPYIRTILKFKNDKVQYAENSNDFDYIESLKVNTVILDDTEAKYKLINK